MLQYSFLNTAEFSHQLCGVTGEAFTRFEYSTKSSADAVSKKLKQSLDALESTRETFLSNVGKNEDAHHSAFMHTRG